MAPDGVSWPAGVANMPDRFDTTRWSLVLHAGGEGAGAHDALESLCRIYRPPVLAYIRAHRAWREDTEDLTQAFFAHLLEQRLAARADPERGRFRAFLLTALKHFLASEYAYASRQRRGGGQANQALDDTECDPGDGPEDAFEREWAQTVLREAVRRLQLEAQQGGKEALFAQLRAFLLETPEAAGYDAVGAALGLRRNTVAVAVHRLRARLQELVREVVDDTVQDRHEGERELRRLRTALAPASAPAARRA
jgi:RNA polymerase sigma factor (sigma-70 family)